MNNCLYVVDKKYSALWIVANSRVKLFGGEIVICDQFSSLGRLLDFILNSEEKFVLFCWRRSLEDLLKLKSIRYKVNELYSKKNILVLIPDYLGLSIDFIESEKKLLEMCHYYYVTNLQLFSHYCNLLPDKKPLGVLHDLPDIQLINKVRQRVNKPKFSEKPKVIWIGNSKWGSRQGVKDHKGYLRIVAPLIQFASTHNHCCEIEVIDSNSKLIVHEELLRKIRISDVLIQTSLSEGTGLPILEALGLGTNVITTPVGIATEVFTETDSVNISESNAPSFHSKIHLLHQNTKNDKREEIYERYISRIIPENVLKFETEYTINLDRFPPQSISIRIRFFWWFRFIKLVFKKFKTI
jgi:glycosyltransferase involved in cell wall biosynthesis